MADWFDLPAGERAPEMVNAVVEVPRGSANKYEYDVDLGVFRLDRVLYSPLHYPGGYGFIPSTLAEDGDPVDILVLTDEPTFPGVLLPARPLGYLEMSDEKGRDQKVLAVPVVDPRYDSSRHLDNISRHRLREIEHFFNIYKELEGKQVTVDGWRGMEATYALIREGMKTYKEAKLKKAGASL